MQQASHPVLPQGIQRGDVEALLLEIAPAIKLGSKRLHALLYMIRHTRPSDWVDPAREPIFFAQQNETAQALGKTTRALRTDEASLEQEFGFIEKRSKANGYRSRYGDCGIIFSRLINIIPSLLERRDHEKAKAKKIRSLVNRRSSCLRHINKRLQALPPALENHPRIEAIRASFQDWPHSQKLRSLGLDGLMDHLDAANALCSELDEFLLNYDDSSAQWEENFRLQLQENKDTYTHVNSNDHINKRPSAIASDASLSNDAADAASNCLENKDEAAKIANQQRFMDNASPSYLFKLASDDLKAFIDGHRDPTGNLKEMDIVNAAHDILPHLSINYSAWSEAENAMGHFGAALCVLLIDANRDHPTSPIRRPGGALRAMTRRFAKGELNLVGSLIGLARRRGV